MRSGQHDIWNKCGPGGAPWRNQRQVGHSFMKSMGWTDKTLMQTLDPEKRPTNTEMNQMTAAEAHEGQRQRLPVQCCINCFCDCKPRYDRNDGKENLDMTTTTTMPIRKDSQDIGNRLCEHTNRCAKKCKYVKPRTCMVSGGVELVPLLARRRAMQRPISLSTTDVTKYPTEKKYVQMKLISLKIHFSCIRF